MQSVRDTITVLEQEIEALDQRRGDLVRAIDVLRPLAGDVNDEQAPHRRAADKAHTNGSGKTPPKTARPEKGSDDELILQHLRTAGGPLKPGELARAVKLSAFTLRARLKPLAKQKLIVLTGKTAGRRVGLPGMPAKEAP